MFPSHDICLTGTLGDYLGVPTTVANSLTDVYQSPMSSVFKLKYYENEFSDIVDIPQNVGNDAYGWLRSKAWTTLTESMFVLKMSSINVLQNRPVGGTGTLSDCMQAVATHPITNPKNVAATSTFELVAPSTSIASFYPTRIYFFAKRKGTSLHQTVNQPILLAYTTTSLGFALSGSVYRSSQFSSITVKNVLPNSNTQSLASFLQSTNGYNDHDIFMMFECPNVSDTTTQNILS